MFHIFSFNRAWLCARTMNSFFDNDTNENEFTLELQTSTLSFGESYVVTEEIIDIIQLAFYKDSVPGMVLGKRHSLSVLNPTVSSYERHSMLYVIRGLINTYGAQNE